MRRHPGHLHRQPKAKTSAVVASLILVLLVLIAIAARFTGSDSSLTYLTESEGTELYLQSPLLQSSLLQDHNGVFAQASSLLSNAAAVTPVPKQPEPALAPKLQSNVLSSFNVNPVTASLPSNPEQTAFVRGYQQLKPVLSATSYIPLSLHTTRGIILPAGKSLRLGSAYVALQLLRETLQCDLPIEIWHLTGEIDTHTKAVFETSFDGVTCRDATTATYPSHHKSADIRGYALKAFALYATSFTEVILLDADNLPVLNPALLFDSLEYQLHGNLFWPDLFAQPLSRVSGIAAEAYQLLGWSEPWAPNVVGNNSFMFAESGQFLLDRRRHADVVEWTWFINSYGDDGVYQQLMNGDKDSFLLAFALADKISDYYQVPEYVRLCLHDVAEGGKLEHVGILHHNPQGQVVFFHRTSGGKVNPMAAPGQLFESHYTTVPLPAQAAYDLFEGAAESGNYRYPRDRVQTGTLAQCKLAEGNQLLYRPSCAGTALQEQHVLPVAILTQQDLIGTQLSVVYDFTTAKFIELQKMMQLSQQEILLNYGKRTDRKQNELQAIASGLASSQRSYRAHLLLSAAKSPYERMHVLNKGLLSARAPATPVILSAKLHAVPTICCSSANGVSSTHKPARSCTDGDQRRVRLALKEWAVTCAALGQGDQTIVLRKGGIREPSFKPAADTFLLFPTSFHSETNLLTPEANNKYQKELAFDQKAANHLTIKHVAFLTGCWTTFDPKVLTALSDHHVWTEEFLSSRLRWRAKQPITVMELRCSQLDQPLVIPTQDRYWGCFSWVDLDQGVNVDVNQASNAVLEDTAFADRQHQVRAELQQLTDCSEVSTGQQA